jgi:hypothetical protein
MSTEYLRNWTIFIPSEVTFGTNLSKLERSQETVNEAVRVSADTDEAPASQLRRRRDVTQTTPFSDL